MANRIETGLKVKGLSGDTNALYVTGNSFINGDVNITGNVNIVGTATTLNTETVQTRDNKILLNYSGTNLTAIGGGIEVLSAKTDGTNVSLTSDINGDWNSNTGLNISGRTSDSTTNGLKVVNSSGTNNFVVRNDGFVGVNTVSKFNTETLRVNGALLTDDYIISKNTNGYVSVNEPITGNAYIGIYANNTNPPYLQSFGNPLYINSLGNDVFIPHSSASLGIGLTSLSARLHIKGIDSSSSNFGLKVQNSGGTDNLVVRNDGNVGIGTATPTAKLEVKSNSSTGNTVYPFSINKQDGSKVLYLSNENYYTNPNNLGVYSEIYDELFNINLVGSSSQFKLNYGDSTFQLNPYPNAFGTRFLFKTNPGGGSGEAGIAHIFNGNPTGGNNQYIISEDLQVGTPTGGTGTTIVGKYIRKNNFNNPTTTFYPLIVMDGNVGIGTSTPTSTLDINGTNGYNQLRLRTSFMPTGSTDTRGNVGDIAWDDNNFYWKTSTQWLRVSGQTF